MLVDRFISAPSEIGVEISDGIALSAEYHFDYFERELFERSMIAVPVSLQWAQEIRQAEFLAGRLIVRHALDRLQAQDSEISIGQDGMPVWPAGLCGSISHTRTSVCCAVANGNSRYIGIDCEDIVSIKHATELAEFVLSPVEREKLKYSSLDLEHGFTLLFSAKECYFKAVYPSVRRHLDFLDIEAIKIDDQGNRVTLAYSKTAEGGLFPILNVHYVVDAQKNITIARGDNSKKQ